MFSRIFYIAIGFAVGYFLDSLRRGNQTVGNQSGFYAEPTVVPQPPSMDTEEAESIVSKDETKVEAYDSPDVLQTINGIGPTYAKRLFDGGIRSMADLASADVSKVAEMTKARNLDQVSEWIREAQKSI